MKNIFKTTVLLFALLSANTLVRAQGNNGMVTNSMMDKSSMTLTDDAGNAIRFTEYSKLVGSPYFNPDWVKGDVKFASGMVQKDKLVKYDELKDALYTQLSGDKIGEFDEPVTEFTIVTSDGVSTHFSTIPGNGKFNDKAYFEVLSDGKVKLLRKNAKAVSESKKDLGSAVITREVVDNVDYYLLISGKVVRIKKDKKSVEATLGNKQTELDAYVKSNSLSLRNDADLAKLITYYNTL